VLDMPRSTEIAELREIFVRFTPKRL